MAQQIEEDVPLLGEIEGPMENPDKDVDMHIDDDDENDDDEGEDDEDGWEVNEEWSMAPVTPLLMSVMC
ncbi:hypothetical protein Tco_1553477 [Tanacetum coccineum]